MIKYAFRNSMIGLLSLQRLSMTTGTSTSTASAAKNPVQRRWKIVRGDLVTFQLSHSIRYI